MEQERSGRRQLPSNKQQLEKGGGREGTVWPSRRGRGGKSLGLHEMDVKTSLDVKEGGKSGPCHPTMGIEDESVLMGSGCQGFTRQPTRKAFIPHYLRVSQPSRGFDHRGGKMGNKRGGKKLRVGRPGSPPE